MGREPDARLLAAVVATVVFGASAYAAIGAALASYSPEPLALFRMLAASASLAAYTRLVGATGDMTPTQAVASPRERIERPIGPRFIVPDVQSRSFERVPSQ
jgi:hypothetical protein